MSSSIIEPLFSLLKDPLSGKIVKISDVKVSSLSQLATELNVSYKTFYFYAKEHGLVEAVDYYRSKDCRVFTRRTGTYCIFDVTYKTLKEIAEKYGGSRHDYQGMSDVEIESKILSRRTLFTVGNHKFNSVAEAVKFCGAGRLYRLLLQEQGKSWSKQERLDYIVKFGITAKAISRHTGRLCAFMFEGIDGCNRFIVYDSGSKHCYLGTGLELLDLDLNNIEVYPDDLAVPRSLWYKIQQYFGYELPNSVF